jgi:hypothetical protein
MKKFERNYADLTTSFIEQTQSQVAEMREREELFHKEASFFSFAFSVLEENIHGTVDSLFLEKKIKNDKHRKNVENNGMMSKQN